MHMIKNVILLSNKSEHRVEKMSKKLNYIKKFKMNSISPNLNLMIKASEKASKIIIRDFGELENLQVSKI